MSERTATLRYRNDVGVVAPMAALEKEKETFTKAVSMVEERGAFKERRAIVEIIESRLYNKHISHDSCDIEDNVCEAIVEAIQQRGNPKP